MLKPVQVPSRAHLSEQSSSEDNDDVWFASSNAHLTGPFGAVLDFLYDVTCTDRTVDVTGMTACSSSSSSSSSGNIGTNILFIFAFGVYLSTKKTNKQNHDYVRLREVPICKVQLAYIARGCSGCTCTPQGGEKNFRRNLQGKFVSAPQHAKCTPLQAEQESILGHLLMGGADLEVGVVHLVDLDRLSRAMT